MSEAAIYIAAAALTVAFASFISYGGGEDKWQKFALGSILLASLAAGATSVLGDIPENITPELIPSADSSLRDSVLKDGFESGIERLVAQTLECGISDVSATAVGFDPDRVRAEKITVYLYGKAALGDYKKVKEVLLREGIGECEVILNFEKNESANN